MVLIAMMNWMLHLHGPNIWPIVVQHHIHRPSVVTKPKYDYLVVLLFVLVLLGAGAELVLGGSFSYLESESLRLFRKGVSRKVTNM